MSDADHCVYYVGYDGDDDDGHGDSVGDSFGDGDIGNVNIDDGGDYNDDSGDDDGKHDYDVG